MKQKRDIKTARGRLQRLVRRFARPRNVALKSWVIRVDVSERSHELLPELSPESFLFRSTFCLLRGGEPPSWPLESRCLGSLLASLQTRLRALRLRLRRGGCPFRRQLCDIRTSPSSNEKKISCGYWRKDPSAVEVGKSWKAFLNTEQ
jgi:hypothetical protein